MEKRRLTAIELLLIAAALAALGIATRSYAQDSVQDGMAELFAQERPMILINYSTFRPARNGGRQIKDFSLRKEVALQEAESFLSPYGRIVDLGEWFDEEVAYFRIEVNITHYHRPGYINQYRVEVILTEGGKRHFQGMNGAPLDRLGEGLKKCFSQILEARRNDKWE